MSETNLITSLSLDTQFSNQQILMYHSASTLPTSLLTACFDLISLTSSAAYAASSRGWHPSAKLKEMREKAMQYLLVFQADVQEFIAAKDLIGFLSYQLIDEDGVGPVIYIYEIHVGAQNRGIGTALMRCVDVIGKHERTVKAMLTVFVSNKDAIRFYERCGYEKWDEEYIPPRKRLRSGVKAACKPSYIIMAKELVQHNQVEGEDEEWETDGDDVT